MSESKPSIDSQYSAPSSNRHELAKVDPLTDSSDELAERFCLFDGNCPEFAYRKPGLHMFDKASASARYSHMGSVGRQAIFRHLRGSKII